MERRGRKKQKTKHTGEKVEHDKVEGQLEISSLREMVSSKKNETEREARRTERLEKELAELKMTLTHGKEQVLFLHFEKLKILLTVLF